MSEEFDESEAPQEEQPLVGERLRAAREQQEKSLEEIAKTTRVPLRSLENIEKSEYEALPAPTYATGFVKAYARAVGLNEAEIGQKFRGEIQFRTVSETSRDYFEPTDPARVPPRLLAWTAGVIAILLALAYGLWRSGLFGDSDEDAARLAAAGEPRLEGPAVPGPASAGRRDEAAPVSRAVGGAVVLEAEDAVWLRIYEIESDEVLFQGELQPGERFELPADAERPAIRTGRAEALRVTVGGERVAPLGPASTTIRDVRIDARALLARDEAEPSGDDADTPGFSDPTG
ncbi:MAG: helix-turn-helix domain-containing protein [Parasphingopyxis sp.]|nr:DUF4115 domain-containing protein [Sphingomonadales bacterium]